MNNQRLSEDEVREAVTTYFTQNEFTVDTECDIQFGAGRGRNHGIADVVVKNSEGYWVAIVECKSERIGRTLKGEWQLKSYLSATDTRFGILASSREPDDWLFFENLRSNVFIIRDKPYFNAHVSDSPRVDRAEQDIINHLKTDNDQWKRKFLRASIALISVLIIAACISVGLLIFRPTQNDTNYQVIRIIDGDTVEIQYEGRPTSVQLIGVDAPETVRSGKPPERYGEEATRFLQDFLLDESVYFRFDENKWDKYDRILAYVYRASDGIFVNLEIIREGYGRVDTRYPFKHEELFMNYQSSAKTSRKGLWRSSFR